MYFIFTDADLSKEGQSIRSAMEEGLFDAFYRVVKQNHDEHGQFLSRAINVMCQMTSVAYAWWNDESDAFDIFTDLHYPPVIIGLYNYGNENPSGPFRCREIDSKHSAEFCRDLMRTNATICNISPYEMSKQFMESLTDSQGSMASELYREYVTKSTDIEVLNVC